jgi:hypothetical protein
MLLHPPNSKDLSKIFLSYQPSNVSLIQYVGTLNNKQTEYKHVRTLINQRQTEKILLPRHLPQFAKLTVLKT